MLSLSLDAYIAVIGCVEPIVLGLPSPAMAADQKEEEHFPLGALD
jgi:hypothetical protein